VVLDLATIKDDIGMDPADTTNDAWLQRRIDAVLENFRQYTHRWLYPLAVFTDDWRPIPYERIGLRFPPGSAGTAWGVSNFLKEFPVKSIDSITDNQGTVIDPAMIRYDGLSGELLSQTTDNQYCIHPVSQQLPIIQYQAGYEILPSDLYDAMIGILQSLWSVRSTQKSGLGIAGMIPQQVTIADVGTVRLTGSPYTGSVFTEVGGKTIMDPLLGPYGSTLDSYKDWRNIIAAFGRPVTIQISSNPTIQKSPEGTNV